MRRRADYDEVIRWVGWGLNDCQISRTTAFPEPPSESGVELSGIHWSRPYWKTISIARRADVEKLDAIIGPKS